MPSVQIPIFSFHLAQISATCKATCKYLIIWMNCRIEGIQKGVFQKTKTVWRSRSAVNIKPDCSISIDFERNPDLLVGSVNERS